MTTVDAARRDPGPILDVVAVGELNPDLVFAGIGDEAPRLGTERVASSFALTLGSSAAICLVGLQRLGARTALVAMVGEDDFGRFCCRELERAGVDTGYVRRQAQYATGVTVALAHASDRLLTTYLGAMAHQTAAAVPSDALERARHVHVTSIFLQHALAPELPALLADARRRGLTTSLDTGWDPSDRWDRALLAAVLPHVDVFLPNASELQASSGRRTTDDGARWALEAGAARVVVKRGAAGASMWWGTDRADHSGYRVVVQDTTGAGDTFDAGFLWASLAGLDPVDCLRLGNACGALTAAALGGTGGDISVSAARALIVAHGEDATALAALPNP